MNHTPAPGPKYKTGRDTWAFRLFGQMRGCQAVRRTAISAARLNTGRRRPPPRVRPRRTRQPPTSCRFSLRCSQVDFDDLLHGRRSLPASGGLAARSCQALSDRAASQFPRQAPAAAWSVAASRARSPFISPTIGDIAGIPLEGSSCVNTPAHRKRLGPFKYEARAPTGCSIGTAGQALKCRRRR